MIKAEKKTLKLSVEKPQYITVNDITYAQVDSWFGHCRRDLKLDIIYPETKDGKIYPCKNSGTTDCTYTVKENVQADRSSKHMPVYRKR